MTEAEILNEATNLIAECEKFRSKAYWDVSRYSIGYGTISYAGEVITEPEAKRRLTTYLNDEYKTFKKVLPSLSIDPIAVPLLSKGYQYGSGVFSSWKNYVTDKEKLISEVFFIDEKYLDRRQKEMEYYSKMLLKYGGEKSVLAFTLFLIGAFALTVTYLFSENKNG
jgi:hypothetical protein